MAWTPWRLLDQQSHNSPVMVTASASATGNRAASSLRAAGKPDGSFHRAKGRLAASPDGTQAAFRFAPPMSRPRIRAGMFVIGCMPNSYRGPADELTGMGTSRPSAVEPDADVAARGGAFVCGGPDTT